MLFANKHIILGLRIYFGVTCWGELLQGGGGQEGSALPQTLISRVSFRTFQGPYVRLICISHDVLHRCSANT